MRKQYEPVRKDIWTGSEYVRACDELDSSSKPKIDAEDKPYNENCFYYTP